MKGQKACKSCNMIYEGDKCPNCGNQEYSEEIKGVVAIFDPEKSEIAKNLKIHQKGRYLIKSK